MAIYVFLQCCKCNSQKRIHLYSCSRDKDDVSYTLCNHFTIRYTYTCKFGFFTLGWSITLGVRISCRNCNSSYDFGTYTFNSSYYSLETHHTCCHKVFRMNVSGYSYASDTHGLDLQEMEDKRVMEEEKKAKQLQEQKKIQKIIKNQSEEEKKIKEDFDMDFIDTEASHLINAMDFEINNELNFDVGENLEKKNEMIKFSKYESHK